MKKLIFIVLFYTLINPNLSAQVNVRDSSIRYSAFFISGALQFPGGDLADRFGVNSSIGLGFSHKTANQWIVEGHGNFMFGNKIEEKNILAAISTSTGAIIAADGRFADVRLFERGYQLAVTGGRLFPFKKPNPNSGFVIKIGPAFMQHKIKIDPIGNNVPQLSAEYRKGYDRLSYGFGLYEFFGYQYMGNKRRINFIMGIELLQVSTKNQRSFNFDQMKADTESKNDLIFGLKFSWIVPLYKQSPDTFYYN